MGVIVVVRVVTAVVILNDVFNIFYRTEILEQTLESSAPVIHCQLLLSGFKSSSFHVLYALRH